ncbi:EamA-like transporter family [Seminavis robusta]|uniref:EamA-like transporter family n=1 Tax=Seminavis robusta TaxID=568900 RepID=A0A9N8DGJ1_9STRA|nr:EamA-like transporter family [Seminavis robusta]|eukprot:Sro114_g056440.1 EamA-like transporter family (363) ;mRNA; r:73912-75000
MKNTTTRPTWLLHLALIVGQIFFGMGSVIAGLGLPACNPFAFALYREIAAGTILLSLSVFYLDSNSNKSWIILSIQKPHWNRFLLLGLAIFGNQAGMIAGIKLAGPVAAAVWQPSQPIMTAAIGMVLGWEPWRRTRIAGIVISFLGCASMVLLSTTTTTTATTTITNSMTSILTGHALFFMNCLSTSIYVLLSKAPLRIYSPLLVTAWSYVIASMFMAITTYILTWSSDIMFFLCPDCQGPWNIPSGAWFALFYFILFGSVGAYALLTWANSQAATGTLVISYTVLQPVTAAILTMTMLSFRWYPNCQTTEQHVAYCLTPPGLQSILGMAGIFTGLALVIRTEPPPSLAKADELEMMVVGME